MNSNLDLKIKRVNALYEMLAENISTYEIAKGDDKNIAIAGNYFPKNSNISKSSIKNQIVTLRNELLLLSKLV